MDRGRKVELEASDAEIGLCWMWCHGYACPPSPRNHAYEQDALLESSIIRFLWKWGLAKATIGG